VLLFLGINYLEVNKPEKAQEALLRGVDLAPTDAQMRFQLGVAKDRLGKNAEAEAEFKKVLQMDPENTAAMNYLGYTWADRGERLPEAEKLLRKAVSLEPENGAYLDSLGWVLYKEGNLKEAIPQLEKAVKLNEDPLIYDHLGDAYEAAQDFTKAADAWQAAIRLDPKNQSYPKKLNAVQARVAPGSDSRKYLKTFEGNQLQMSDLRSHVSVHAKWNKRPVRVEGRLFYQKPDGLVLQIPGSKNVPEIRMIVNQSQIRVVPPEWAESLSPQALEGLRSLPQYFSGRMINSLDDVTTTTESIKEGIRYVNATQEVWVDPQRGSMVTRWIRTNPDGGRDEMTIAEYRQINGLWLPIRMRLRNKAKGWDAQVQFSDWVINQPEKAVTFK
jgi:tetratricopeptide (TPR) repeat protein